MSRMLPEGHSGRKETIKHEEHIKTQLTHEEPDNNINVNKKKEKNDNQRKNHLRQSVSMDSNGTSHCPYTLRTKLPQQGRALSIIVTLIVVIAVIGGIIWLIIPPMIEQFEKLGGLATNYIKEVAHISSIPETIKEWTAANGTDIQEFFKRKDVTEAIQKAMPRADVYVLHTP